MSVCAIQPTTGCHAILFWPGSYCASWRKYVPVVINGRRVMCRQRCR